MGTERKTARINARVPKSLLERVDFVARNTDAPGVESISTAVQAALEAWLPGQEERLVTLGVPPPKKARS